MIVREQRTFPLHFGVLLAMAGLSGGAALAQAVGPAPGEASASKPASVAYGTPGKHVILMENTLIRVMTDQGLSTQRSKDGTPVTFTVSEDVIVDRVLAIPRGATVRGEVVEDRKAGRMTGSPELVLKLDSLELGGESYPVYAYQFQVKGASKEKPAARDVVGGAEIGALAGGVVAGRTNALPTRKIEAEDMAAGAAAGVGAVVAASALAPKPVVELPAESEMDFYLASPISVQPVSEQDAERLAARLHAGGPVLYVRGEKPQ